MPPSIVALPPLGEQGVGSMLDGWGAFFLGLFRFVMDRCELLVHGFVGCKGHMCIRMHVNSISHNRDASIALPHQDLQPCQCLKTLESSTDDRIAEPDWPVPELGPNPGWGPVRVGAHMGPYGPITIPKDTILLENIINFMKTIKLLIKSERCEI